MKADKIITLSVCAAIVITAGAGASFWFLREAKKPKIAADFSGQTPDQIRAFLRSKDFNSLDDQTRRTTARVAFRQITEYRVNEYFAVPADKRTAYLDKLIDEMEARRKERALRGEDPNFPFRQFDPNSRRRRNDPNSLQRRQFARGPEGQRARMESIDPLTRAKNAAFRDAMRARMAQRGISAPGGPGGGGRSGGRRG